jgi:hypothetical protein
MISTQTRFVLGCILLGLGVLCGLAVPFLGLLHITHNKAAIVSFLMLSHHGLTFLSIAVMGQTNFERLTEPVHRAAAKAGEKIKPAGNVSRKRYRLGIIMLVTPLVVVTAMHLINDEDKPNSPIYHIFCLKKKYEVMTMKHERLRKGM